MTNHFASLRKPRQPVGSLKTEDVTSKGPGRKPAGALAQLPRLDSNQ
jgi:hypothetical protein